MWIQIILVISVILIGLFFTRPSGSDSHLALRRLFLAAFVLVAVLSILFPQWLTWIANLVGVGRGTDLLLYALVMSFLVYVSTSYRRNVLLNRKLTSLARQLAISKAQLEDIERSADRE